MEQMVLEDRFFIIQNGQLGYVRVALGSRWSLEDRFIIIQNGQLGYVRVALCSRWSQKTGSL